jgi:uncharacterized damage-inducible protein DinB
MNYRHTPIADETIPQAVDPVFQHLLDTYASEINKLASVWACFTDADLGWRPHDRSSRVEEILRHQLLSERRFFGEFLGVPEPAAAEVLPPHISIATCQRRLIELAQNRLPYLAGQNRDWWLTRVPFFGVDRERVWVFWRRVLHTGHHRTQLTMYLRLLDRNVPSTYGPTADVTWEGADPTHTADAAERR